MMYHRAIDEVYWRHVLWPSENSTWKPALDAVMPLATTVSKWTTRCTVLRPRTLLRTADHRRAAASRDRAHGKADKTVRILSELWSELGNDPYVTSECLARPLLADRFSGTISFAGGMNMQRGKIVVRSSEATLLRPG